MVVKSMSRTGSPLQPNTATRQRNLPRLLRAATAHHRSQPADTLLAVVLTFVAGAVNAGGFLAIGQYTSHMTGIVSAIADHLVLGSYALAAAGVTFLITFTAGAATSAILINWGRRHTRRKQYAYPIALEALLLLAFGVLGTFTGATPYKLALALPLLCFLMGLQNATITKLSGARIRTTHLTGMITDIGIEIGKLLYLNRNYGSLAHLRVVADRNKLALLAILVTFFLVGGIVGAFGFSVYGYVFCVPLAALLLLLALPQLLPRRRISLRGEKT
ncbi:MAG: putative rane protein YoaK, family [Devosia sp.]|nr:putative rane protein YoaK, family [Devosia sp.]